MFDYYIHLQEQNISEEYKNCRIHIALERADMNKDLQTFRNLYSLAPVFLRSHLNMTECVFDYNYLQLDKQIRDELFIVN